jgi:hypothetical protein
MHREIKNDGLRCTISLGGDNLCPRCTRHYATSELMISATAEVINRYRCNFIVIEAFFVVSIFYRF